VGGSEGECSYFHNFSFSFHSFFSLCSLCSFQMLTCAISTLVSPSRASFFSFKVLFSSFSVAIRLSSSSLRIPSEPLLLAWCLSAPLLSLTLLLLLFFGCAPLLLLPLLSLCRRRFNPFCDLLFGGEPFPFGGGESFPFGGGEPFSG